MCVCVYGSWELKTLIISEVKVEKMAIEDTVQMRDIVSGSHPRIAYHRVEEEKSLLLVFV